MISIITSLYRSEKYIKKFCSRIVRVSCRLNKKGLAHEFVLVANDPTAEELKVISNVQKILSNIKLVTCPRESLYASWNRGVEQASYQICSFWNVDDRRYAKGFVEGFEILSKHQGIAYLPFFYKRYVRIATIPVLVKIKKIKPPVYDREKFMHEMHIGPFFMFDKNTYDTVGPFDASFKIAGDFDWQSRAAEKNISFYLAKDTGGSFANDGRSLSGSKNSVLKDEIELVLKNRAN